jgi:uncharacterized lipoprotein YddW (UPF0748 family)
VVGSLLAAMTMQQLTTPEVRATWLTTTSNEAISSPTNTASSMRNLRNMGLNTVYSEVWKNGYTEFPSTVMQNAIGVSMKINPSPSGALQRDLLEETMIQAHRNGLIYVAWFEYGLMAAWQGTFNELRAKADWLSADINGNVVASNGFVWMNPIHPEVQNLLIGIVKEAVQKYDLDGIQLDDRIAWPDINFGYDAYTRSVYAAENGGQQPPSDPNNAAWKAWRQAKVEAFSKRFVQEIRAAGGPNLLISLAPASHPFALTNYLVDWPAWSKWSGIPTWDEYVPQVYRMTLTDFQRDWPTQVTAIGSRRNNLVAGIRLVGTGNNLPANDVALHPPYIRSTNVGGHSWWFSRGVTDVFPTQINGTYNAGVIGQSPHPRFGYRWRSFPIELNRMNGVWTGRVPTGRYRVIARSGASWRTVQTSNYSGRVNISVPNADAVELLISRRL